jgi:hypothetical protein
MSMFAPVLVVAALAGCAGHIRRCPEQVGVAKAVHVRIDADTADPVVRREVQELLEVRVGCKKASYDPVTEQARWPYWVELMNTQKMTARSREYAVHLTGLERNVTDGLDVTLEDKPVTSLRPPFKLDALRADLHIGAGQTVVFPCAESIAEPRSSNQRVRSGVYTVRRSYTGDVTIGSEPGTQFVPVRIEFYVEFVLPEPEETLRGMEERARAQRQLEWRRITDTCETCRPLIICESLRPTKPAPEAYEASKTPLVHFVAGLERRPVVVDPSLAERKRTVACTRWSPVPIAAGATAPVGPRRQTDSTEQGLPEATPYLLVHHEVPVKELLERSKGRWSVELFLAEVLDNWEDLRASSARPEDGSKAGPDGLVDACQDGRWVSRDEFEVR